MARIALAIDDRDWHARELLHALSARGATAVSVRLSDVDFDGSARHGMTLPSFGGALPDAVLVRAVSAGSFESVTRRLGVLHALDRLGVPVWNDARSIERCVDKSMTSFCIARAGLPTPPTWAVEGKEAAYAIAARECAAGALVLKPLFGSQGRGLRLITRPDELPEPAEVAGVYYLQRYLPTGTAAFCDHRLFVCAGEVVAAMTRHADRWVTNLRRGGRAEAFAPTPDLVDLAVGAAECVGARYAGVDLLRDNDGSAWVLEVNSMPGWKGLQKVTPHSIADRIAAALLATL